MEQELGIASYSARTSFLTELRLALLAAPRLGAETDEREGERYIQISDTLVKEFIVKIERLL